MAAIFTLYGKNYWFWLLFERSLFVKLKANSWIQFHPKSFFYVDFYVDSLPEELDSKNSKNPFLFSDNLVYPWLLSIRRGLLLCHISDAGIIKIILCVYQL